MEDRLDYLKKVKDRWDVKVKGSAGEAIKRTLPSPCPSCTGRSKRTTETIKGILGGTADRSGWTTKRPWQLKSKAETERDLKDVPIRLVTCGLAPLGINKIDGSFVKWNDFNVENPRHAEALTEKLKEDCPTEFSSKYAKQGVHSRLPTFW